MDFEKQENSEGNGVSRRDFLKLSASGVLGLVLSELGVDSALAAPEGSKFKIVHGVEVYGLDKPISSTEEAKNLTFSFDLDFERKLPKDIKGKNRWEQREYAMPKDKRLVQFVVTESAYKEFQRRKTETGVDYVEWVQIHLDLMNRMSGSQPGLENFRTEIKRVIVVSDDFKNNPIEFSKDVDAIWFNNEDYRDKDFGFNDGVKGGSFEWIATVRKDGAVVLGSVHKFVDQSYNEDVILPMSDDSLQKITNSVKVDWGLIHELMHRIWNLPDEYVFDCTDLPFRFKNFQHRTWSFQRPYLSPYLKVLLLRNKNKNIRGYYTDPRAIGGSETQEAFSFYGEIPQKITFQLGSATNLTIDKSSQSKGDYYSGTVFSGVPGLEQDKDGSYTLSPSRLAPQMVEGKIIYSTMLVLKADIGGSSKQLYFPISLLNIPAILDIGSANFKIDFTWNDPGNTPTGSQVMEYVLVKDYASFSAKKNKEGVGIYATMLIPGTNYMAFWYFDKS